MRFRSFLSLFLALQLIGPTFGQEKKAGVSRTFPIAVVDTYASREDWENRSVVTQGLNSAFARDPRVRLATPSELNQAKGHFSKKNAEAADDLKQARDLLGKGKGAYQKLKFGEAIVALEQARKLFIYNLSELRSNRDLIDAHLFLGMAYVAVGKNSAAQGEFEKVVLLDPRRELSSKDYSPKIIESFSKARQNVMKNDPVKIRVESNPEGGAVYLNGRPVGKVPLSLTLQPAEYFFLVEKDGFRPWYKPVKVERAFQVVRADMKAKGSDVEWAHLFRVHEGADQEDQDVHQLKEFATAAKVDFLVLATITQARGYRVLTQLYDARTSDFSTVAVSAVKGGIENFPEDSGDTVDTLLGFIGPNGYLSPKEGANLTPQSSILPVAEPIAPANQMATSEKPPKAWYEHWWIYPLIVGAGAAIYLGATQLGGSSGSKISVDNSGNF